MRETIQSVKEYGVIVPAIVRPREEGGYEIVAGHRRKYACEQAGLDTMPVLIRNLDPGRRHHHHGGQQPSAGEHPAQRKGQGIQDEAGGHQAAGRTKRFDFAENFGEVEKR